MGGPGTQSPRKSGRRRSDPKSHKQRKPQFGNQRNTECGGLLSVGLYRAPLHGFAGPGGPKGLEGGGASAWVSGAWGGISGHAPSRYDEGTGHRAGGSSGAYGPSLGVEGGATPCGGSSSSSSNTRQQVRAKPEKAGVHCGASSSAKPLVAGACGYEVQSFEQKKISGGDPLQPLQVQVVGRRTVKNGEKTQSFGSLRYIRCAGEGENSGHAKFWNEMVKCGAEKIRHHF